MNRHQTRFVLIGILCSLGLVPACGSDEGGSGATGGSGNASRGGSTNAGNSNGNGGRNGNALGGRTGSGGGPNQCLSIAKPVEGASCATDGLACENASGVLCLCERQASSGSGSGGATGTGGRRNQQGRGGSQNSGTLLWNCFGLTPSSGGTGNGGAVGMGDGDRRLLTGP